MGRNGEKSATVIVQHVCATPTVSWIGAQQQLHSLHAEVHVLRSYRLIHAHAAGVAQGGLDARRTRDATSYIQGRLTLQKLRRDAGHESSNSIPSFRDSIKN